MTRTAYIDTFATVAIATHLSTGLFPSVALAQGITETARKTADGSYQPGLGPLFEVHNHFGIKANSAWHGDRVCVRTWEVVDGKKVPQDAFFRAYSNPVTGFYDRVDFLRHNPRYVAAGVFLAQTALEQIKAIFKGGWATNPNYVRDVFSIVSKYGLEKFDAL